ncbi:MAG: biotin--[acetyl-CoA-carboxylase] ligase [Oscillospiraceae bacterium]|nr:biotin--[acetyl-CoA-carboxylase] ligase [Oscillospiraceae bacterium]
MPLKNKIILLKEVDSTNDYAKRNFDKLENGSIISAEIQSKGRGQFDRIWFSSPLDIKISIIIKEDIDIKNIYDFSIIPAAAVMAFLNELNIKSKIKWPNDIMVDDKKIAGILVESFISDKLEGIIIGIGINITDENKISLKDRIISLETLIKFIPEKLDLIIDFMKCFNYILDNYLKNGMREIIEITKI